MCLSLIRPTTTISRPLSRPMFSFSLSPLRKLRIQSTRFACRPVTPPNLSLPPSSVMGFHVKVDKSHRLGSSAAHCWMILTYNGQQSLWWTRKVVVSDVCLVYSINSICFLYCGWGAAGVDELRPHFADLNLRDLLVRAGGGWDVVAGRLQQ